MKESIHPQYNTISASCSCGAKFELGSTSNEDLNLDVCSHCHPFYTGKQKQANTGGRVERFNKRFGAAIKR
ncbi:50S ribosomal protein L31 [Halomonadaceae bacterium LMG 33818]|uniref:50S ribosomal protein L31 n=1 Tax=Cernens ardua TaxID=3402176 RepID=UPI003EDBD7C1